MGKRVQRVQALIMMPRSAASTRPLKSRSPLSHPVCQCETRMTKSSSSLAPVYRCPPVTEGLRYEENFS